MTAVDGSNFSKIFKTITWEENIIIFTQVITLMKL